MSALQATVQVDIPFEDVDMFGVVWHGNFAKYFERVRCALLQDIGYTYINMREQGYMYPVVDLQFKFIKPIAFGQKVDVVATLVEWEHMLKLEYEVRDYTSGEIFTKGSSKHAAVVIETMELLRVCPNDLAIKILAALGKQQHRSFGFRGLGLRRKFK